MTTCAVAAAACGPGAKMSLAYATGPFSVPRGPAGAPRTTGGQILYGALQSPPQNSPWSSLKSAPARCEPIPAFPLLPETPTCPAWPSAASTSVRCEPFSPNRLTPASRAQAPGAPLISFAKIRGFRVAFPLSSCEDARQRTCVPWYFKVAFPLSSCGTPTGSSRSES